MQLIYSKFKHLLTTFILLTIVFVFSYKFFQIITPKYIYNNLILILVSYVFFNLWFYFNNLYQNSIYTSSVQRFWKRTYSLFWLIEGFLFFIVLYLLIISPQETTFFIDSFNQNKIWFFNSKDACSYLILTIVLLYFWQLVFFFKKTVKKNLTVLLVLLTTVTSLCIFILEFKRFLQVTQILSYNLPNTIQLKNDLVVNTKTNNFSIFKNTFSLDKKINRTEHFYNYLIIFLKFWHLFFINFILLLTVYKYFLKNTISFDLISSNNQNLIYIVFFALLVYLTFFKQYFYYFLKQPYFWFFENTNSFYVFYYCFVELYLLFIYGKFLE